MQNWTFVVYTTTKHIISRRGKNENVCEMLKCTCEIKTFVFHCQICKFLTFLLPPSSWLLKLPILCEEEDEESLEEPVVTFETPFSISLWLLYMISCVIVFVLVNVRLRSRSAAVYYNDRLLVISFSLALFLVLHACWKHLSESFTMVIQP